MTTTTKTTRITKAMHYGYIKRLLDDWNAEEAEFPKDANGEDYTPDRAIAFIDAETALLAKKNSGDKKPTKAQTENAALKATISDYLRGQVEGVTASDVMVACGLTSNQKSAALLNAMVSEGNARKETVKGKSLFYFANPSVEIVEGE